MREKALRWINWIREQELDALGEWLKPLAERSAKLLEVGGGNGFLAKCLADMDFEITCIDLKPREPSYFTIQSGDCTNLQFKDNSFDIIFSSNLLEHVSDFPKACSEMRRVLVPGGFMVHTMPTPLSTVLTLLTQPIGYFFVLAFIVKKASQLAVSFFPRANHNLQTDQEPRKKTRESKVLNKHNIAAIIKMINPLRLIISPPHGTSSSCFAELRDWKPEVWCKKFQQQGLHVKAVVKLPIAYSRHAIFPFRFVHLRRRLAQKGKASCVAYMLQN